MKRDRKRELDRLRALSASSYPELLTELSLVLICVTVGAVAYQLWWLFAWYAVQYTLVAGERVLLKSTPDWNSRGFFAVVVALNLLIGSNFALLSVLLWQVDDPVYKFAVIALLVGSTLNTFLVRTKVWQSMLCYVIPNGVAVFVIASTFTGPGYQTRDAVAGMVIAAALVIYLLVSVLRAYRWHDSYEKTRLNLELARRSEAIGRLTGGIAHDFNNLLFVILGNLEALRQTAGSPAQRDLIDAGIRATERGADLTGNMLRFARQANLTPRIVDLNAVVAELTRFAARTLPGNIAIETDLAPDLWRIEADASSTESALLNMVLNARDAMPGGGRIRIVTANETVAAPLPLRGGRSLPAGRYVTVAIEDDGQGIAEQDLARIFEPFATTKPNGTGLGLAMIDLFMDKSGGGVSVASDPGAGTTFRLYFRARRDKGPVPPPRAVPAPRTPRTGARILVVEDEPNVRETLLRTLEG
ncbi:MAG: ATP-binding protein, partial [Rhodovulum sp.]